MEEIDLKTLVQQQQVALLSLEAEMKKMIDAMQKMKDSYDRDKADVWKYIHDLTEEFKKLKK